MSELLNRTIGGYQLLELIGGGGVAEVFRAQAVGGGARDVAVKVIFPEFARQPGVAANFAQITRAAAQLASHPHILPVLGSGEDHEFLYLVTPLVKEGTLEGWLRKGGRLGVSDVAPFFQQLCGAVSYAHSLGMTHGNLRPSNVYLFEGRHVLLGDFGLLWDIRALDPSWSGSDVAAFEYLAPEVFDGRLTPASDIYSLGAMLFATLTGRAPFSANKLGELIAAARQQTPPSLAQESPALAPAIVALDAVVRQAMAKQPEQRFPSAVALGQGIEATLRQAPQTAPQAPGQPPLTPAGAGQHVWGQMAPAGAGAFAAPPPAAGAAPLARLDPPFPPLPPAMGPDSTMELGGAGMAAASSVNIFAAPPTQRVEPLSAVMDFPTVQMASPSADLAPQVTPDAAPGAQSGQFSATELGLPRLTNPAMGDLPPDWRDLVTDESARKRHDPFAMSESSLAPLPAIDPYGASRDGMDAIGASELQHPWEPSEEESAQFASVRGVHADYDIERMAGERPVARQGARAAVAERKDDTLQSQKVWTNSHMIVRGKRRPKAPLFTIVALLALAVLELAGLAVMRPDICVAHACTVVAGYARRAAPGLRIPWATAPVHVTPLIPKVSVMAEGTGQTTFTLVNNSVDPIKWSATPTLPWMSVSPASGALKGGASVPLKVTVQPHGVAPGLYTGALVVAVGNGASEEPVLVTVEPGPELTVAQRALSFSQCGVPQSLSLSNSGGQTLNFQATSSTSGALSVSPGAGALDPGKNTALAVSVQCGAATGQSYAVIIVSDGGSAQVTVTYS